VNPEQYKVMLETFLRVELHVSKFCCVSNKMEQLLKQQKFPCRSSGQHFWADSFLVFRTSPFPPAGLTMEYHTTSSMLKAGYMV
jgi:hypothetical protein